MMVIMMKIIAFMETKIMTLMMIIILEKNSDNGNSRKIIMISVMVIIRVISIAK